jgi:hypothetical protein
MATNMPRLTFFCPRHQELCYAARGDMQIVCEQGPHALSENALGDRWEFCCACQSFVPRAEHEAARDKCLVCDRRVTLRYLCDSCDTLSFETSDQPKEKLFTVTSAGMPQPACPCCLTLPQSKVHEHRCDALKTTVYTARVKCPCCGDATASLRRIANPTSYIFPPTFNKPVAEYLANLNPGTVRGGTILAHPNVLTANPDGQFWLLKYRDEHFIALPGVTHLDSARDYAGFRPFFDCDQWGVGELVVHSPAVAAFDPATSEYILTQKGRLEVCAKGQSPSPPVTDPLPTPPPQPPLTPPGGLGLSGFGLTGTAAGPGQGVKVKPPLIAAVSIAALIIGGLAFYFLFTSQKREIISKLKQGQLVTPQGGSAYDLFLKGGLSESSVVEIRGVAVPLLTDRGNQAIRQLVSDGYNPTSAELGETARVYEWLERLDPQPQHQARKHYFQGRQAYESKDYDGAENEFRQAMRLDSAWALPVNTLARVFMRRKDFVGAQNCYQKAIELEPQWMFPRINLCVLSVENTKNFGLAEEACRGVLQLDQNKSAGHYFLGRALEAQGYTCPTLAAYQNALSTAGSTTNPGFDVSRLQKRVERLAQNLNCETH